DTDPGAAGRRQEAEEAERARQVPARRVGQSCDGRTNRHRSLPPPTASARRNAAAEAANTEASNAVFTPVPMVMPVANASRRNPLRIATARIYTPAISMIPRTTSKAVTNHPNGGISDKARYGLTLAV